jgi:hypothetical protein
MVLVNAILGGLLVAVVVVEFTTIARAGDLWIDYVFYRDIGAGWLQDGSYYLPHQLTGVPYDLAPMADVLYPPHALFLFVPLVFVPAIVWWAIPIAVIAYAVWRWRPAPWAWAAMIVLLMWPRANAALLFGNTDMWMAAGVAAGLIWGWPALILTLKPTLLPFALLGANRRAWWAGSVVLLVVGVAMIPLWLDYVTALRTVHIGLDYSLGSLPLVLVPMVAWLGRRSAGDRWRSTPDPDQGGAGTGDGDGDRPPSHESQTTAPQIPTIATEPTIPSSPPIGNSAPISGVGGTAASRLSVKTMPNAMPSQRTRASGMRSIRNTSAPYA